MEAVILVIHLIVAVGIIITILLQPSEAGGFVGNAGSMSNMGQRRSGNPLTRATTILAGIFFLTSIILAITAGRHPVQQGILDIADQKPGIEKAVEAIIPDVPIGSSDKKPAVNKKDTPAPSKKPEQKTTGSDTSDPEPPTGE